MNAMNPKVDAFIGRAKKWQEEFAQLRMLLLESNLTEAFKWGVPCYTLQDSNVVLMHGFKEYCALLFVKGALLKDVEGILIAQTENTQAARHLRFTSVQEIVKQAPVVKACIEQAIEVEKAGLKVAFKPTAEFSVPEEFQYKMAEMPALKTAFSALTPGRQRAYLLHFAAPKQAKTREARIAKCTAQILNGKGLNDNDGKAGANF